MRDLALADEFWLVAHETTGQARLHARSIGVGLAAALLGELVLAGRLDIAGGEVSVVSDVGGLDPAAMWLLRHIIAEPQHTSVRTWLRFCAQARPGLRAARSPGPRRLRRSAVEQLVASRLEEAGRVAVERSWRRRIPEGLRGWADVVPTDRNRAAWARVRLQELLRVRAAAVLGTYDSLLLGLVAETGLGPVVFEYDGAAARARLRAVVERLQVQRSAAGELLREATALIGTGVAIQRH